jgi:hypothetical protein
VRQFPFSFWKSTLIDPTTLPGFTAMYRQGDYVAGATGLWTPRATTIASPRANLVQAVAALVPTAVGAEPVFVYPGGGTPAYLITQTAIWTDYFDTVAGYTCFVGFQSTKSQAPAISGASYDDPQMWAEAGGFWGMAYPNRAEAWAYSHAYQPGIVSALATNTWTIWQSRYNPAHAAADRFQARQKKTAWISFGADPSGIPTTSTLQMLAGTAYTITGSANQFEGTVRFILTYNQPLSDSDADKVCDWAAGTWPVFA